MTYLLDTSILIDLLRVKPVAQAFINDHENDTILTSCICEAEVYEGIYREKAEDFLTKRLTFQKLLEKFTPIVPFDSRQAEAAGKIRADLAVRGSLIGDLDILIAAAAISQNATLVTKNIKHFEKIPGLQVVSL